MHYFTGTTKECWDMIQEEGAFLTKPPHRVWETYSEEYVYVIPFDEHNEEQREEAFRFAAEQASFAVYELGHTERVVLEMKGIDSEMLEEDPDGRGIGAMRYPFDISITHVCEVFEEETAQTNAIIELITITHFLRKKDQDPRALWVLDDVYDEEEEDVIKEIYEEIGIRHLQNIPLYVLQYEDELMRRYDDLMEEVEYNATFVESNRRLVKN